MNGVAASPGRFCNNHLFLHAAKAKSTGSTITAGLLHSLKHSIQGWLMHSQPRRTICTETHAASSEEASLKPRLKGNSFWSENNQKIRKQKGNKCIWVFSEMSFPRFDRLVLSDGGPLLIQYISDACVSSRQNDKQFFLYLKTNQRRLRGALLSWRYIGT